jgi:hypothetical protein
MHSVFRRFAAVALWWALALAVTAAPYQKGDKFEAFTTKDQHDKEYTYPGGARLVLVAFVMPVGKATNAYLEKQPASFLDDHKAIYLSNIYGMPGIGRTFALPKMRKYPHRILLADAENFLARYPSAENKLTVLRLDDQGIVTDIQFVDPKDGLSAVFEATK